MKVIAIFSVLSGVGGGRRRQGERSGYRSALFHRCQIGDILYGTIYDMRRLQLKRDDNS